MEHGAEELRLVRPDCAHQAQYEEMMEEWETFGGRLNPGALRRYSRPRKRTVTYGEWLKWVEEDSAQGQDLFFLMKEEKILGALSIRFSREIGTDGHTGFGIRPTERRKGYASRMLALALPIMRERYGIDPVVVSCDKENVGSAKTIRKNGGCLETEILEEDGNIVQIYHISYKNKSLAKDGIKT